MTADTPRSGYARETLDAIRAATDLVALIREDIEIRKAGASLTALCPFHDEKTPSFTVSPEKQFYHCFGCGAHGDALTWMQVYHRLPFRHAVEALAGRAGIQLADWSSDELRQRRGKRVAVEVEKAALHELTVLSIALNDRVAYREIPQTLKDRFEHLKEPPQQQYARELEAAKRLARALYALYGVAA